jgi:hypothetical protein
MPNIFEYLGIIIRFYSNEHEPIHIHTIYGNPVVKVSFFIKDGKIYRTTFVEEKGSFPPQKMKQLNKFVSIYKLKIAYRWEQYLIWILKVTNEKITKTIKNEDSYN